ncbi:MAG: hypothetical protein Crog4KO_18250 [Crocinitomicaceae bacterium]
MTKALCLLFIFGAFFTQAQFEIDSFVQRDQFDFDSKFPIIRSDENPDAAERINIVLHHRMLEKVFRMDDDQRFEMVFPPEGEFQGASEFEYYINANNERFFSISITCSYTGAYSEYHTSYFNFDAKTGQPILLSDMFGESARYDLSEWVNASIYEEISDFMSNIDLDDPDGFGQEQYDLYDECSGWYEEVSMLSDEYYFMTDSTITFVKGRCSNHMMAALDDLWEFYEEYSLLELQSKMSDDGIALMFGEKLNFSSTNIPEGKILEGTIGGKYPITMIISNYYGDNFHGVYWYNKVKKPIKIEGKVNEFAFLELEESVNDKVTGHMKLQVMSGGMLEGDWTNSNNSKKLEMKLTIGN